MEVVSRAFHYYVPRSIVAGMASGAPTSNDPALLILTSLSSGPKHGYALTQDIEAFAGVRLGPGTLYGALTRLEDRGLIEPLEAQDRRRPYRISADGAAALATTLAGLRRILDAGDARLADAGARLIGGSAT